MQSRKELCIESTTARWDVVNQFALSAGVVETVRAAHAGSPALDHTLQTHAQKIPSARWDHVRKKWRVSLAHARVYNHYNYYNYGMTL